MTKIEGKIFKSVNSILTNYLFYLFLFLFFFYYQFQLLINTQTFLLVLLLFTLPYVIALLTIVCFFNSSILIEKQKIVVSKGFSSFKSNYPFKKDEIVSIKMKPSPNIETNFLTKLSKYFSFLLPLPDYKWIEVSTINRKKKFYFLGIEHDYYDNPEPYFEDIFVYLKALDYNVGWTNENHTWPGLEERVHQLKSRL